MAKASRPAPGAMCLDVNSLHCRTCFVVVDMLLVPLCLAGGGCGWESVDHLDGSILGADGVATACLAKRCHGSARVPGLLWGDLDNKMMMQTTLLLLQHSGLM